MSQGSPHMSSPTLEAFLEQAHQFDLFSAIENLQSQGTPAEIAERFRILHLDAYWKQKDLPTTIALAQAGILFCLTHARIASNPEATAHLRAAAKGLAYNLASFTWPGWDEPAIRPTPDQTALGLHAARLNLRLAHELCKPPDKIRAAHWLLGAQLLAAPHATHLEEALTQFRQSIPPESDPDRPLYTGYLLLAQSLLNQPGARAALRALFDALNSSAEKSAREAHDQLRTAQRIFGIPPV